MTAPGHRSALVQRLRGRIVERRHAAWRHSDWLGIHRAKTAFRERTATGIAYLRSIRAKWSLRADRLWRLTLVTIRDFPYDGRSDPWPAAVREVQRVFPGSESWVLSCSDAEGWGPGLTRWILFEGKDYYPGAEHSRNWTGHMEVGGPGQYVYGTFVGHFRRGLEYLRHKGYRVPAHLRHPTVTAWRSATGQAIAMGAAFHLDLRGHHWSASYGRGC